MMDHDIKKLSRQPLNCVLAEFRFSPVLKIESYIADFQDGIRKQYPVQKKSEHQSITVAGQSISASTNLEWLFMSADQRSAVLLGTDRLVFVTSHYDRFPDFEARCMALIANLIEAVSPSLLLRIGLRYNDLVVLEDETPAETVVKQEFLPNNQLCSLGTGINYYRTETSIATEKGTLLVRSLVGLHGLAVMPDLAGSLPIKVGREGDKNKLSILLDFDHFWTAPEAGVEIDIRVVKEHLGSLHSITRAAFWETTTDHARDKLWQ